MVSRRRPDCPAPQLNGAMLALAWAVLHSQARDWELARTLAKQIVDAGGRG